MLIKVWCVQKYFCLPSLSLSTHCGGVVGKRKRTPAKQKRREKCCRKWEEENATYGRFLVTTDWKKIRIILCLSDRDQSFHSHQYFARLLYGKFTNLNWPSRYGIRYINLVICFFWMLTVAWWVNSINIVNYDSQNSNKILAYSFYKLCSQYKTVKQWWSCELMFTFSILLSQKSILKKSFSFLTRHTHITNFCFQKFPLCFSPVFYSHT